MSHPAIAPSQDGSTRPTSTRRAASRRPTRVGLALASLVLLGNAAQAAPTEWRFRVLLGNREIGEHVFRLEPRAGGAQLRSEARFNLRLLGVNAFSYNHEAVEQWQGECLDRIESKTEQNSRSYAVTGVREGERFSVRTLKGSSELPGCVMSFAYWNPSIVRQRHLLNPQNGDYEDITVEDKGMESVSTMRGTQTAHRYTLVGRKARIDLWYAQDGRWIGLESTTDIGQRLRYILV